MLKLLFYVLICVSYKGMQSVAYWLVYVNIYGWQHSTSILCLRASNNLEWILITISKQCKALEWAHYKVQSDNCALHVLLMAHYNIGQKQINQI